MATQSERSRASGHLQIYARVQDPRAGRRHEALSFFLGRDEVVIVSARRFGQSILDPTRRVADRNLRNLIVNKLLTRTNVLNKLDDAA